MYSKAGVAPGAARGLPRRAPPRGSRSAIAPVLIMLTISNRTCAHDQQLHFPKAHNQQPHLSLRFEIEGVGVQRVSFKVTAAERKRNKQSATAPASGVRQRRTAVEGLGDQFQLNRGCELRGSASEFDVQRFAFRATAADPERDNLKTSFLPSP